MRDSCARKAQVRKAISAAVNGLRGTIDDPDYSNPAKAPAKAIYSDPPGTDRRDGYNTPDMGSHHLASLITRFWEPLNEIERHGIWQAIIGDHEGCDVGMPPGVRVKVGTRPTHPPDSAQWGKRVRTVAKNSNVPICPGMDAPDGVIPVTAPSTPLAREFEGFGSGLKPAFEPIVVARKPLIGTLCENAEKWGTGGLAIDRCRIATIGKEPNARKSKAVNHNYPDGPIFQHCGAGPWDGIQGRWPANLVLSHSNLPLMRKCGIIPLDIEGEIRRYFNDYTKVQELRSRVRDPRLASTAGAEVLQSEMHQRGQEGQDSTGLQAGEGYPNLSPMRRGVRDLEGVGAERAKKVLQLGLQDRISEDANGQEELALREASHCRDYRQDIQGEKGEIQGQGSPQMAGQASHYQRLSMCPSRESKTRNTPVGGANGNKERIHIGTPSCDGDKIGPPPDDERESASYQRCQRRQSPRESDGPGSQDSFPKASGDSQANWEVGTGEFRTQGRDCSLEVLACDIPREWLDYFEFTGEDLGCRRVGAKQVQNKDCKGKASQIESQGQVYGGGQHNITYADPDGYEQVEDWICVESCPVRLLDEQTQGQRCHKPNTGQSYQPRYRPETDIFFGDATMPILNRINDEGLVGGPSRFYKNIEPDKPLRFCYTAKSSRAERTCQGTVENKEPTVKPVNLCRYLERLVARPGAVILDPFCGSGSFGVAAILEGFHWIGMDNRLEACQIAKKRCEWAIQQKGQPRLFK